MFLKRLKTKTRTYYEKEYVEYKEITITENKEKEELAVANQCIMILNKRVISSVTKILALIIKKYENIKRIQGFEAIKNYKNFKHWNNIYNKKI